MWCAPDRVYGLVLADSLGAMGDGGMADFGAELGARATPETLARIAELAELSTTSKEQEAAVALEYFRLDWPGLGISHWPEQRLRDDHALAVERHSRTFVQPVPERNRLADPMAERRVVRASEDSVNGQAIRGNTHVASIPGRLRLSRRTRGTGSGPGWSGRLPVR